MKHIPFKCECKFDGRKCNLNQKLNNDKCLREWKSLKKNIVCAKKDVFGILQHVVTKMVNLKEVLVI